MGPAARTPNGTRLALIAVALVAALGAARSARANGVDHYLYRVLLDTDNNAGTGCDVAVDALRTRSGERVVVVASTAVAEIMPVYNLEVAGVLTYFVSAAEILVHNK